MSNIYKLKKKAKKKIEMKQIFDSMFSIFTNKLISKYLMINIENNILKYFKDNKIKHTPDTANYINQGFYICSIDLIYYCIIENNKNIFLPKKLNHLHLLENVLFTWMSILSKDFCNKKIPEKDITRIIKKSLHDTNIAQVMKYAYFHHHPPLISKHSHISHEVKMKKKIFKNIKKHVYYMYNEKNIVTKLPIDTLAYYIHNVGFRIRNIPVEIRIYYYIEEKYATNLKKIYTGKNLIRDIYYLLVLYSSTFYILQRKYDYNASQYELVFKNNNLKEMYNKSTELLGNPLFMTKNKPYFSLFPEIDKYFGSIGSFNDVDIISGTYSIQVPVTKIYANYVLDKVEKWLDTAHKNNKKLTFILFLMNLENKDGIGLVGLYYSIEKLMKKIIKNKFYTKRINEPKNTAYIFST